MEFQGDKSLFYDAFMAIAASYTSMVFIDTEDDTMYPIRLDNYSKRYEDMLEGKPKARDVFKRYVEETVFKDDRDKILRLIDIDYVSELVRDNREVSMIYRAVHKDNIVYYRLKIVQIEEGKKLIYAFENVDDQYRKQIEANSEKGLYDAVVKGLSREYLSVWYLDGASRKIRLIMNNGSEEENGEAVRIGNMMIDYHFSMQKYFDGYVDPEDFERLMNETSYESIVAKTNEKHLYRVSYIRINPDQTRSQFMAVFAKIVDEMGVANFVVGFKNMDPRA